MEHEDIKILTVERKGEKDKQINKLNQKKKVYAFSPDNVRDEM
jgi:hypothetical protein